MNWERAALVAALGALAASWWIHRRPAPTATAAPAAIPAIQSAIQSTPVTPQGSDSACRAALASCESNAWRSVADAIRDDVHARRTRAAPDAGAAGLGSTPVDQQRELCDLAREHLRKGWKDKQTDLLAAVHDVGTAAWNAKELDRFPTAFANYGLTPADERRLRDGYAALLARDGARIHDALAADPPLLDDLLDEVKVLYRDEDALVRDVLGADALARHRADQRRSRTAILAIAATFANEDWDDAIAW